MTSATTAAASSTSARVEEMDESFPLFDLPPELWLRICRFAIPQGTAITVRDSDSLTETELVVQQPAITRTCSAIRRETVTQFYTTNEFRFVDDGNTTLLGLQSWACALLKTQWSHVRNCTLESDHEDAVEMLYYELGTLFKVDVQGSNPKRGTLEVIEFTLRENEPDESQASANEASENDA